MNEDQETKDLEEEERMETSHPNTPSMYVQKHHPESHILGNKEASVQNKRKLIDTSSFANFALLSMSEPQNFALLSMSEPQNFALLSMSEPQNFVQASQDDHWVKAMNEELDQIEKNNRYI